MRKLVITIFSLILFNTVICQNNQNGPITAYRLKAPLKIDGILNESLYENSPVENFTQLEPNEGRAISEKTMLWISYDNENLYFSGKFYDDEPDSIDQSLMRRDNLTESDWIWIYIDPYNDDKTGNYFAVNAGGSICDGTLYNDIGMDDSWDGIWDAETTVDDESWIAEIRIPFSQLRFHESDNMVWGINLNRDIKRKHEMSFYVMVPKTESGFVSRFVDLKGLKDVKTKQRIEFLPYIVQKAQYLRNKENDPFYKKNQYKTYFGGDLKFSIGSNLNVDATINPDFGQVEVDPAIVNLTAFENYYSEKRPFFIEGNDIFRFATGGINNTWGFNFGEPTLYYSRRIGRNPQGYPTTAGYVDQPNETRILGAAKLTGKIDETWSIGLLSSITERTFAQVQTPDGKVVENEVEPFTHYGVFRTRKEFNDGKQALGVMFTSVNRDMGNPDLKNILADQAYVFGTDGWFFLDNKEIYAVSASLVGSYIHGSKEAISLIQRQSRRYFQRPDRIEMRYDNTRTSLSGMYGRVMVNKQEGNFYLNSALGLITPGFEYNDLGFQTYTDRINGHFLAGYRWFEPDGLFRKKSFYLAVHKTYNFDGDNIDTGFYLRNYFQFMNFWAVSMVSGYDLESVSTTFTRGGPKVLIPANFSFIIQLSTDTNKELALIPKLSYYNDAAGSYDLISYINLVWKPEAHLTFSAGPEYAFSNAKQQWVGSFADDYAVNTFGRRYVYAEMEQKTFSANIRLNWSINPTLSLQMYLQPLLSVGNYADFKELARSDSKDYDSFSEPGSKIEYNSNSDCYTVDPDNNGPADSFSFYNPNFNYKSIRSNIVLRWEVLPGSVFYAVWTHDKLNFQNPGIFDFVNDFKEVWNSPANNIFLLKFSYWFNY